MLPYLKRCLKLLIVLSPLVLINFVVTQSSTAEVAFDNHSHFAVDPVMADGAVPLSNVFTSPLANPLLAQSSSVGAWVSTWDLPIVTIHAAMLPDGKFLTWDREETSTNLAKIIDPITESVTASVPNGAASLFCAAHALLPDGRMLLFGGHINADYFGINQLNIFNPSTRTWSRGPNMAYARWYPSAITLSDGRILVVGGSINTTTFATIPEIYNPTTNTFTQLNNASLRADYYPQLYLYPNDSNRVFLVKANDGYSYYLDLAAGRWTRMGAIGSGGMNSSSVMYSPGKIMLTGQGRRTWVIDLNQSNPTWRETASMAYSRTYLNLTILPDGKVLVTGGSNDGTNNTAAGVLQSEMWNPATETWTQMTPMRYPRMYHSVTALATDGYVFTSGGGHGAGAPVSYFNAETYAPSYLYRGNQPTISSAPTSASYGQTITVGTPDASNINSVVLISTPSVTHAWNENQRYISRGFTRSANSVTFSIPTNRNTVPPGYYMLFILNSSGVPSTARIIRISGSSSPSPTPTPPPQPTATPINPTATPVNPTATPPTTGFPSTGVLDNFNRANGSIGSSWAGNSANFAINNSQLDVLTTNTSFLTWQTTFGSKQELFVTMRAIDTASDEIGFILKSQSATSWQSGLIEIWYQPSLNRAQVWTYHPTQDWVQQGGDITLTLQTGDRFGARARADGFVEVYRNGTLVATRDIRAWPLYAGGGRIGFLLAGSTNTLLDDFGGGTAP